MLDSEVKVVSVVLNYNDYKTCEKYISEIKDYSSIDKIIIVDNCSSDESYNVLSNYTDEKVVVMKTLSNKGYSNGNNCGMKYAVEHYPNLESIIVSNPDIHIKESDLILLKNTLKNGYGMVTGVVYNYDPSTKEKKLASNFGWKLPNYRDMLSNCFLFVYKFKRSILKNSFYLSWEIEKNNGIIMTEAVPGCFFALDVNAVKKMDYLDDSTFLFGEETILGYRLKKAGYSACIVNNTEILHENSVSINKSLKNRRIKAKYRYESECIYLNKYLQCNKMQVFLFTFCYWLGFVEQSIWKIILN